MSERHEGRNPLLEPTERDRIADQLTRFEFHVPVTGPAAGLVNAGSFADAVIETCGPILREPVVEILTDLIAELRDAPAPGEYRGNYARDCANAAEARLRELGE